MKRLFIWNVTVVSAMAGMLAGCGPDELSESEPTAGIIPLIATTVPKGTISHNVGGAHILPMVRPDAPPRTTAPLARLQYYGGHVIANVKVEPVYWGTGTVQVPADMHGFYAAVTNSTYMDWLSEYDTSIKAVDGSTGTNQHIGRGTVDTKDYPITPSITSKSINDDDIQAELGHQIDIGKLPAPDENTIYMIHFPLGMHINLGGSGSCSAFCAYHSTMSKGGKSVYYSVLPYLGTGSGCEGGCGTGSLLANHTSVASHELIEAVTDGEIGLVGGSIGKPAAWYDSANGEIGDICNASQGTLTGTTYTIQKEWSNQAGACIADKGVLKAPTVALTAPTAGTTVSATVTITATATETGDTISKVDFYVDGTLAGSDTASPYSLSWDTTKASNASHSLTAKATDSKGNVGTSAAVSVTVKNTGTDTTPPVVSVTSPSGGTTVTGAVTITATATDPDDAVAQVDFYAGTTLIGTKTAAPYSVSWDSTKVSNGTYSLTAKGTDSHGNAGTSTAVSVTVMNTGPDTTPPVVSVTSPSGGSTVTGAVTITATATDPDDAVVQVDFYAGTTLIGTKTAAPYSVSWDSTKVSNGTYSLTAKGTDSHGNLGTSTAVSVTVSNGGMGGQTELEPNNNFTTANSITDPAGLVTGYMNPAGDTDFFKLLVPPGKTLVVDLTVPAGKDYDLYAYNSAKTLIAQSENDVGIAEHLQITNTGTTAITRYIEVRDYFGFSSTVAYKLTAVIK